MKNGVRVSLLIVPALLVTGASLLILLVVVAGAASSGQQSDLGSLQGPALQSQSLFSNDASPNPAPVSAPPNSQPKTSIPVEFSIPLINDTIKLIPSLGGTNSAQSTVTVPPTDPHDTGIKAETEKHVENEKETEKENENETETSGGMKEGSDDSKSESGH